MALGNFIKNNLALVAGLAVPVLLVAGFLVSSQVGRSLTDPPRHIAYFVMDGNSRQQPPDDVSLHLSRGADGRIVARLVPHKPEQNGYAVTAHKDVLLAYDFAHGGLREIPVAIPEGRRDGTFTPTEVADVSLAAGTVAADGYALDYASRRGGFIIDIFTSQGVNGYRARKGPASYRFQAGNPAADFRYYTPYSNARFLGWTATPATLGDKPQ
jgi:hypothetical protein